VLSSSSSSSELESGKMDEGRRARPSPATPLWAPLDMPLDMRAKGEPIACAQMEGWGTGGGQWVEG